MDNTAIQKYFKILYIKRFKEEKTPEYIYIYIYIYIIYNMVYVVYGLSGGSDGKESACNVGDLGQIPELGRLYVYMCVYIYIYIFHQRMEEYIYKGFLGGSDSKESAHDAGDPDSIPGAGRSPGEGNGYPLQYPCLENSMDRGAWQVTVHVVAKS